MGIPMHGDFSACGGSSDYSSGVHGCSFESVKLLEEGIYETIFRNFFHLSLYSHTHVNKNKHVCLPAPDRTLNENISWGVAWYEITDLEEKCDITCNIILRSIKPSTSEECAQP